MPTFLDIEVLRIQGYLGRWPKLAGRRAASAMVSGATSRTRRFPSGATWNSAAGDVDGKISLILDADRDPREAARAVLSEVAEDLPGAALRAAWAQAETYSDAYERLAAPGPDNEIRVLPEVTGFPLSRCCDRCRLAPAITYRRPRGASTDDDRVCSDCAARSDEDRGRRGGLTGELATRIDARGAGREWCAAAKDLGALARCVPGHGKGNPANNHVAAVFIDGNSMGRVFSALTGESDRKLALSAAVVQATKAALDEATLAAIRAAESLRASAWGSHAPSKALLPVVPHVVGGDDVLVTVPAPLWWPFVRAYLQTFSSEVRRVDGLGGVTITASAGVCITGASHPISDAIERADRELSAAKSAVVGGRDSFRLVDLDFEGSGARSRKVREIGDLAGVTDASDPDTRQLITLEELLDQISMLEGSARSEIRRLVTAKRDVLDPMDLVDNLERRLRALQRGRLLSYLRALRRSGVSAADVLDEFADLVAVTRWWTPAGVMVTGTSNRETNA